MASQVSFKVSPKNGLSSEKGGSSTQGEREEGAGPVRIEGYVNLKRKNDWVKRYATVDNCIFSYKKTKLDKEARKNLDLRRATIKYSAAQVPNADSYIKIDLNNQLITIDMRFSVFTEFQDWLRCLKSQTEIPKELSKSQTNTERPLANSALEPPQRNTVFDRTKIQMLDVSFDDKMRKTMPLNTQRQQYRQQQQQEQQRGTPELKPSFIQEEKSQKQGEKMIKKIKFNIKNTYSTEDSIKEVKKRLDYNQNSIKWHRNKSKHSIQVFTDRSYFLTSQSQALKEELNGYRASVNKDRMDIRQTIMLVIGLFISFAVVMRGKDYVLDKFFPPDPEDQDSGYWPSKFVLALSFALQIGVVSTLRKLYSKLGETDSDNSQGQVKKHQSLITDDLHIKFVTSIQTTPYFLNQCLTDSKLRPLWDIQSSRILSGQKEGGQGGLSLIRNDQEIALTFQSFMSPTDTKTIIIEEFYEQAPKVLFELTTTQSCLTVYRLTVYAKLSGDIPSLKQQTKDLLKSLESLIKLASQLTNASIQSYQIEDESSEEEDGDESFEVQTDQQKKKMIEVNPEDESEAAIVEEEDPAKAKLDLLLQKLGPFQSRVDVSNDMEMFTEVYCIEDWNQLMHRYKPQYMPQIKKAIALPQEFEKKWAVPEWKQVINDKKVNLQVWQRTTPEGLQSIKATSIINRTTQQIFRVIGDDNYKYLYDPVFDSSQILERIADQTFLVYHKTKKVSIVGPRDFVLMLNFNMTPEGVIYAIVTESGLNHLVPETKSLVRAALPMGGWKLEPLKEDPSRTRCDYIAEIDLKGHMPGWIMSMAIKDQGYQIIELGKAVEKFLKDKAAKKEN